VVAFAATEFRRLEKHLLGALAKNGEAQSVGAMEILESLVTLLLDPSGLSANARPSDSYRGLFLLLRTLTSSLRLLAETEDPVVLEIARGWNLASLLQCCAQLELHRRDISIPGVVLERPQGGYFTSLRAFGDAEEPGAAGAEDAVSVNNPHRAGSAAKSLTSAVREVSAPLLRCTSSIAWSVIRVGSDAGSVRSVVSTLVPHFLTWLSVPEMDIRADLSDILVAVCRFQGGDESVVSALLRPLQHKLAPLGSLAVSAAAAAPVDKLALRSAAGAMRCLGGVVSNSGSQSGERTRLREAVLEHVSTCLKIDSGASEEFCLLQVVALEVMQTLCAEEIQTGPVLPLLLPLLAHADARVAVPALAAYAKLCIAQGVLVCTLLFRACFGE
jgi:hypothetical protein